MMKKKNNKKLPCPFKQKGTNIKMDKLVMVPVKTAVGLEAVKMMAGVKL